MHQKAVDGVYLQTIERTCEGIEDLLRVPGFNRGVCQCRSLGDDSQTVSARQIPAHQSFGVAIGWRSVEVTDTHRGRAGENGGDLTLVWAASRIGHAVVLTELCRPNTKTREHRHPAIIACVTEAITCSTSLSVSAG